MKCEVRQTSIEKEALAGWSTELNFVYEVPLNTALLALQTLEAMDVFKKSATKDCEIELTALQGSLRMMSQVLNDVLDFSR
jgi:hypothetical protein